MDRDDVNYVGDNNWPLFKCPHQFLDDGEGDAESCGVISGGAGGPSMRQELDELLKESKMSKPKLLRKKLMEMVEKMQKSGQANYKLWKHIKEKYVDKNSQSATLISAIHALSRVAERQASKPKKNGQVVKDFQGVLNSFKEVNKNKAKFTDVSKEPLMCARLSIIRRNNKDKFYNYEVGIISRAFQESMVKVGDLLILSMECFEVAQRGAVDADDMVEFKQKVHTMYIKLGDYAQERVKVDNTKWQEMLSIIQVDDPDRNDNLLTVNYRAAMAVNVLWIGREDMNPDFIPFDMRPIADVGTQYIASQFIVYTTPSTMSWMIGAT